MPYPNPQNTHRELNVQVLDTTQISSSHEWDVYAQVDISFRQVVEENPQPRADACRYKILADVNVEAARSSFSRACTSTTLFKIPNSIACDRTFARDAFEAYYVDAMQDYLYQVEGELKVEDIPLLKHRLHSRYFCAFSNRQTYFNEHYERRRLQHWATGDSSDLEQFTDLQKASWFPKLEAWVHLISQPSALPVPTPFALCFYHQELRNAQLFPFLADTERIMRLKFCARREYYILFLSTWWNELYYGGRAFVIKKETIAVLSEHCGTIPNICGKPAQAIIERMHMFEEMPHLHRNWICFRDGYMESSLFIFAIKRIGLPDHSIPAGRRLWCSRDHRSITVSQYSSRTHRRLELLEERVSEPNLDLVPGLFSLIREQEWAQYTSLRVGDLLHNLVALYFKTHAKLDEAQRELSIEERRHDDTKKGYDHVREDLHDMERSLHDNISQIDAAKRQNGSLLEELDDARREIHNLKRRLDNQQTNDQNKRTPRGVRHTDRAEGDAQSLQYSPEWDVRSTSGWNIIRDPLDSRQIRM